MVTQTNKQTNKTINKQNSKTTKNKQTNVEQSGLKSIVILHCLVTDDTVKLLIGKGEGEDISLEDLHIGQVSCLLP